jgi:hypothetical protein
MPIETRCLGCGKLLRVADEHAGKQARCPGCGYIYQVAGVSATATNDSPAATFASTAVMPSLWFMKTPEGQIYGPVSRDTIHQWIGEARVTRDCFIREGERGAWQSAVAFSPTLHGPRTRATAASTGGGYAARPAGTNFQHRPSGISRSHFAQATYQQPHRGALILTFALLGWFFCPIFAVVAWSMGSEDLNRIRLGQMDPSGRGITQAGQILGMIQSILFLAGLAMIFLFCLVGAASG